MSDTDDQRKRHRQSIEIRQTLSSIPELTETLAWQYPDARLSSTISIGSGAWDQLYSDSKPRARQQYGDSPP
ncbi:Dyp-type peroxidase domain-containing protein [Endozoicomonas sp. YOMI1]|uniref:Dyp-type peroxidase domain-containing protein n=1 Tax=Endozoicomonas sp. YOMI1 TaxID=2828739 RepID=UPI0035A149EA